MKRVWTGSIVVAALICAGQLHGQDEAPGPGNATVSDAPLAVEQTGERAIGWTSDAVNQHLGGWGRREFLGIELWRYVALLVALLVTFIAARFIRWLFRDYAMRLAERTRWQVDDLLLQAAARPASVFVTSLGVYGAVMFIMVGHAPPALRTCFGRICFAVAASAALWYVYRVVEVVDHVLRRFARRTDTEFDDSFVDVIRKTLRVFILVVGIMIIGKNVLKWDITALLASAGVVGLAVAFAAQDTVANFFGTLMLLLDKPFRVGERVLVDGADGPVEAIGFRSTRIRTLQGHQVSIPNKTMANATIENVGRRRHIKRLTNIAITYDTPVEKVEKALSIIRGILANHRGMDPEFPPRVFFSEFNNYSLNILMIAWYHPGEYWQYLEWCEDVNLRIMRQFEAEGIEFAFPTSTTYLAQDTKRPLTIATNTTPPEPK